MVNGELLVNGLNDVLHRNFYSYTEPDHAFTNHVVNRVVFYFIHELFDFEGLSILYMMLVFGAVTTVVSASRREAVGRSYIGWFVC